MPVPVPSKDLVVRVVPDQSGITKAFDYTVPPEWAGRVAPGTRVRIALGPRRVAAWVVAVGVEAPPGVTLRPIAKISGHGPAAPLIELATWASWRWSAKSVAPFLKTASPERMVPALPPPGVRKHPVPVVADPVIQGAFWSEPTTLQLGPSADIMGVVQAAAALGDALYLCPSHAFADRVAARLRRAGVPVARMPQDWAQAAAGGAAVVGTRAAAWAPVPDLAAIVVFDEHDEVYKEESSPAWHARDVAIERARRAGVPCVLTSPMPTVEAQRSTDVVAVDRTAERAHWPVVVVVDRRDEDTGRNALFSPAFARVVRSEARVVAILNQKGRAALLACATCRAVARCERCDAAVAKPDADRLVCRRCTAERPVVCQSCGGLRLQTIRMGVSRVAEDLAALAGESVGVVTGDAVTAVDHHRLIVGTEAALHRVEHADVVAFLDFDQELFAPRYRAAEEALALLVRAGRITGGRGGSESGRVLVQTLDPDHEVLVAAVLGNPDAAMRRERDRRRQLDLPPYVALAEIGGEAGEEFVRRLGAQPDVAVMGPTQDRWHARARDHETLCNAIDAVDRPRGRLRLIVDPLR